MQLVPLRLLLVTTFLLIISEFMKHKMVICGYNKFENHQHIEFVFIQALSRLFKQLVVPLGMTVS